MLNEKIEQLKQLLAEMGNPNSVEYKEILRMFNAYRTDNSPKTKSSGCTHEQLVLFLARSFINYDLIRLLRAESKNEGIKAVLFDYMFGLFYEMVNTIRKHDPEGWEAAGFDITPEEMLILREHRNTKFHVQTDTRKFLNRHQKIMSLNTRFIEIVDKNGTALTEYMFIQSNKYPEIKEMLETALLPTAAPNFIWDNYKPNRDNG